jgi:hypothetical protein
MSENRDSESDSDVESLQSSPDNTLDYKSEPDKNDIKLTQMRRGAQKRGGQVKIAERFGQLISYDEMLKQHAFQRMKDGIYHILSLHSAVELSSLCGCLELKVQEKGATSIRFITEYLCETNELDEARITKILNFMWEGALWEYLHAIGHPVKSMRPDPKKTIMELWQKGGILESSLSGFVPHFVAREVKKRNDWIQSKDIQDRLEKLRKAQDATKTAERKVISEHDYTNILSYFNQMSALRRLENSVREYLISEVEILRSRIDSCDETTKMIREQLGENESQYMKIVDSLNEQLALSEFICEERIAERYQLEGDMQRLSHVLESYIASEENREMIGGGTMQALKLRNVDKCCPGVRALHAQVQKYRQIRDHMDSTMRAQARSQQVEVERLNELVDALQSELEGLNDHCTKETQRANKAERALFFCRRQLARSELRVQMNAQEAWSSSARFAAKHIEHDRMMRAIKPPLMAGLKHANKTVYNLSRTLLTVLDLEEKECMDIAYENACMRRQEFHSTAMRAEDTARRAAQGSAANIAARTKGAKSKMASSKGKKDKSSSSLRSGGGGESGDESTKSGLLRGNSAGAGVGSSSKNSRAATPNSAAGSRSGTPLTGAGNRATTPLSKSNAKGGSATKKKKK